MRLGFSLRRDFLRDLGFRLRLSFRFRIGRRRDGRIFGNIRIAGVAGLSGAAFAVPVQGAVHGFAHRRVQGRDYLAFQDYETAVKADVISGIAGHVDFRFFHVNVVFVLMKAFVLVIFF